jgi:hypothetical protein
MKKVILSVSIILSIHTMKAQWTTSGTNIYNTNTGSVGIGTVNPITKLHVDNGAITVSGNNPYGGPQIVLGPAPSNNNAWSIESMTSGLNFWRPALNGQANFGNYFLFLKHSNGNVGIKTDNPTAGLTVNSNVLIGNPASVNLPAGYKLYVETGILTEKVKVAVKNTANWADYVFAKGYELKPLSEVETFINANKHLPGVPSAEEVVEEGIDMAGMDAKLLEKIEELTLYVIKMEKEINELKKNK